MSSLTENEPKSLADLNKKKVHKCLKNVLTSPHSQCWCPVQNEDLKTLQDEMEKNLPALKSLKSRISWKHLKKLSKEERAETLNAKKNKIKENQANKPIFYKRSFLCLGLNETSKALQKNQLSCIAVDGDSKSKRVAVFLVNLALTRNTPVVICPGLLQLTLSKFGFKCLTFGIKQSVVEANVKPLINLQNVITQTFTKQPTLGRIICDKLKQILNEVKNELELEALESAQKGSNYDEPICTSPLGEDVDIEDTVEVVKQTVDLNLENIYKYRTDKSYRVFVPKSSLDVQSMNNTKVQISEDFISVSSLNEIRHKYTQGMSKKKKPDSEDSLFVIDTEGMVKSPVVKKVKPNVKRVKKK